MVNNMRVIDADDFKKYAGEPSIYDTTDLKAMIDEQPTILVESLKHKIKDVIDKAILESQSISKNNINKLINADFNFGKYHAYMDILKEIDYDSYVQIAEKTKLKCNEFLCNIENIQS